MRIAHTSDWHIGRTLHGVDLHQFHERFFEHLTDLVRSEKLDAVLVSGDIYDRAIPPVDSVELLSDTLAKLSEITQVVLTPGNHDSAIRLGFGAQLMRPGIHIQSRIDRLHRPITLEGSDGSLLDVYGLPYLDPDSSRGALSRCCDESIGPLADDAQTSNSATIGRSHEAVMQAAMERVRKSMESRRANSSVPSVVMAHAFVVGGNASESERDIRVGGVDSVPSGVFAGPQYIALGHLHGAQNVSVPGSVARYSGSPLAFSFSEMNHKKSTTIVEFADGQVSGSPETIATPVPRKMSELRGTLDYLLGPAGDPFQDDWLRVYVTDERRPQEMNARLKQRFPHVLVMQHEPEGGGRAAREAITVNAQTNPTEVAGRFIADVTSTPATEQELHVLEQAIDLARAAERSA